MCTHTFHQLLVLLARDDPAIDITVSCWAPLRTILDTSGGALSSHNYSGLICLYLINLLIFKIYCPPHMEGTPAICHIDINLYYTLLKLFPKIPSKNLIHVEAKQ